MEQIKTIKEFLTLLPGWVYVIAVMTIAASGIFVWGNYSYRREQKRKKKLESKYKNDDDQIHVGIGV